MLISIFAWTFAGIALVGVLADLRHPPSNWRFVCWTVSNAGNLVIMLAVARGWIHPGNALPGSVLYAIYLVLALWGLASWCVSRTRRRIKRKRLISL